MADTVDLIVVGAGPAGMAAATSAADLGVSVIIVDQQAEPGGQIYRGLERLLKTNPKRAEALGEDYMQGVKLVRDFRASTAQFRANTMVWQVDVPRGEPQRDHAVFTTSPNGPRTIQGRHIVIATGAVERATAFPGWTLPGVMTCGAAQILLKTGPNQLKAFTRCGMGPCQGRLCGPTVVETIADARGVPPDEVGYYRIRSPVSPVTVGDIARSSEHASAVGRP